MIYFVYFIQVENSGPIKIGISWDIFRRLTHIQSASYEELHLIGDIHCRDRKAALALESELHQQFKDFHIRGEWFRAEPEVLAAVPAPCSRDAACISTTRHKLPPSPFSAPFAPFSLPLGKRRLDMSGAYPPWADAVDRKNLSALDDLTRRRMMTQAKRWCGSGD